MAAFGSEPVPPDSIVDGAIIDGGAVAEAIRRLFTSGAIKTRDVAASLSGNAVIVKKITLPQMSDSELAESIYWEAEQYIPFDIQDVNLDYQILDKGGDGGKATMDVLLVAAKKEKIADYTGVIAQAGRSAVVVDVDAFALQNAYEVNYGIEPGAVVALLNAGASATNINILNGDQSVFTRDISIGGNAYTEALQKELNLPFDLADQLKRGHAGRRRDVRRRASGAASRHRKRDARDPEDVRLLQDHGLVRSHRSHHAERRRVARRGLHRDAERPIRCAGRRRSIHSSASRSTRRNSRLNRPLTSHRRRRLLSGSHCGGWAIDDPHQPPRGRSGTNQTRCADSSGAARHHRRQPHPHRHRALRRLVVLVAASGLGSSRRRISSKGEREMQQLRSVLAQVQKFEASKAQLQQRVTLIEQLRRGQSGPVHILDEISKAVPERLWLTDMTQKGDDIVLAGMTTSLTGLSDFVANLEGSTWFKKPVDIVDSQVMSRSEDRRHLQVLGQGRVQQPGGAAATAARRHRRARARRASGEEVGS